MESSSKCNFFEFNDELLDGVQRVCINGRRGTGKSTGVKLWISSGKRVIWIQRSKELSSATPDFFVPPAVADLLPQPEPIEGGDFPLFAFGDGLVQCFTIRAADDLKQTGVGVGGYQAEAVIHDEYLRVDGRYIRGEPEALDCFAETAGRSGTMPPVICLGNPLQGGSNRCPYAHVWRTNLDAVGVYEDRQGRLTRVVSTAACADCYGKIIGRDAEEARYCAHISDGGFVVKVDDVYLRIRYFGRGCAVCLADPDERAPIFMVRGRWTMQAQTHGGLKTIWRLRQIDAEGRAVFDGFEAEAAFYRMIKVS